MHAPYRYCAVPILGPQNEVRAILRLAAAPGRETVLHQPRGGDVEFRARPIEIGAQVGLGLHQGAAAQYLDQSPPNLQFLQTFMASSPDQRVNLLKAIQNNPGADQAFPIFKQMMTDCKNY